MTKRTVTIGVAGAADLLGISKNLVYKLVKAGEIPSFRLGQRRILIPLEAILNIINSAMGTSSSSSSTPFSANSINEAPDQLTLFDD